MAVRGRISPEKLPPTDRATYYHGLRVHFQIVEWLLKGYEMNAVEWGWRIKENTMTPLTTDLDIAPLSIKNMIRCHCKSSSANPCSTRICTCKKYGLPCFSLCTGCRGEDCENCDVSWSFYSC